MLPQRRRHFCESCPYARLACVLGSLGGWPREESVKVFYSDRFVLPLPEDHRFPMIKYSMLRKSVADVQEGP